MKHLAAYCLLVLGGNNNPTVDDVEKLLKAAGVKSDAESLATCVAQLSKAPCHEHIAAGLKKMGSVAGPAAAGAPAAGAPAAVAEEKPKAPSEKEESVDIGDGFNMFGDEEEY